MRDYLSTGDGLFTALTVLESMIQNNNKTMTTFEKFPQVLINVPIVTKKDLNSPELSSIIKKGIRELRNGRIVVRYSGTELLLRIMVEDVDHMHAQHIGQLLSHELAQQLTL